MNKTGIAAVLTEIGLLLELKGENPFKIRAYRRERAWSSRSARPNSRSGSKAGTLQEVKGIGEALAQKITELHTTGRLEFFENLKASVRRVWSKSWRFPASGRKVRALQQKLGIESVAQLRQASEDDRIGPAWRVSGKRRRRRSWPASTTARPTTGATSGSRPRRPRAAVPSAGLRQLPEVQQVEACGGLHGGWRRSGTLTFWWPRPRPPRSSSGLSAGPGIMEVTARGETKASVRLASGLQADLRLVPPEQFVFTLHHLTGSKGPQCPDAAPRPPARPLHERMGAVSRGWNKGSTLEAKKQGGYAGAKSLVARTEADLFQALGLAFVPPELREGMGEIEAAEKEQRAARTARGVRYPRGVHDHTTASDGHNTLEEMVAAAQALGLDYLGIADHSKSSVQARGLSEERLTAQIAEIGKLNAAKLFKCHVFTGTECDILPDGKLDFDAGLLAQLDYTVVSIHSSFRQERDVMTRRIIRAIEQPRM